ncbi:MAG: response regulator transcription factor [Phenylobacterium sp.]
MSASTPAFPVVIIVDDDPAVRAALAVTAELDGYRVTTCPSGEALLNLDLPSERACLVIDERLPGLSGLRTLHQLRERGCRLPAVMITSHPTRRFISAAAQARLTVLEKPLIEDNLINWIRAAAPK